MKKPARIPVAEGRGTDKCGNILVVLSPWNMYGYLVIEIPLAVFSEREIPSKRNLQSRDCNMIGSESGRTMRLWHDSSCRRSVVVVMLCPLSLVVE